MASSQIPTIRKCSKTLNIPEMYKTSPPPHHPESNPGKIFRSPWPSAGPGALSGLEFARYRLFEWENKKPEFQEIPKMQSCTWIDEDVGTDNSKQIAFTWIGHAGCHFRIPVPESDQFITILTDPVLSNRCSPVQWMGPSRFQSPPTSVNKMASDHSKISNVWPDLIVLSHNHYDHLDLNTIKSFISPSNNLPIPHFVCTLGVKEFFLNLGIDKDGITELDWWDEREFIWEKNKKSLRLTCVPAQHFSGRSLFDRAKSLWAGFVFETFTENDDLGATETTTKGKKVYFAGDSGYRFASKEHIKSGKSDDELPFCPAFEEIGKLLGPIDLSAIPIGAYKPKPALSAVHMDPIEAIKVHKDVKSKQSIGIHWGSFDLSAESYNEPPTILKQESEKQGLGKDEFTTMRIGQTKYF